MTSTDYFNLARCAEQRMALQWDATCDNANANWRESHEWYWREHATYMALQRHGEAMLYRNWLVMNQYDPDCF